VGFQEGEEEGNGREVKGEGMRRGEKEEEGKR